MNIWLPKEINRKNVFPYSLSIPAGIVFYFVLFLVGYILTPTIDQILYIIAIGTLDALIIWFLLKDFGIVPKIVVITIAVLIGFIASIVYIEIAHEHAMWKICLPAIENKNGALTGTFNDPVGKDGYFKSWYQHIECEDNLLPFPWGREAKFSDIPPGFIPKEATSEGQLK